MVGSVDSARMEAPSINDFPACNDIFDVKKVLKSTLAKALATTNNLPEIHLSTSLAEALRHLENESDCFLVRGCSHLMSLEGRAARNSDLIFSRMTIFRGALEANSIMQPIASIPGLVDYCVDFVSGDDNLEKVVEIMANKRNEEVGVVDQGVVRGVITCKKLLSFLRYQEQAHQGKSIMNESLQRNPLRRISAASPPFLRPSLVQSPRLLPAPLETVAQRRLSIHTQDAGSIVVSLEPSLVVARLPTPISMPSSPNSSEANFDLADMDTGSDADSEQDGVTDVLRSHHQHHHHHHHHPIFSDSQLVAQVFCSSWCARLLIFACLVADVAIGAADFAAASGGSSAQAQGGVDPHGRSFAVTGCLLAMLLYERAVRAYGFFQHLRAHPCWVLDGLALDASVLTYVLVLAAAVPAQVGPVGTVLQLLRLARVCCGVRGLELTTLFRRAVSSDRNRFTAEGFDLDLTYIADTPPVIAMSLPAVGAEAGYRNPLPEVQRFFATRHPGRFLIFNLCRERAYDPDLFDGRVERIEVDDHCPPRLGQIVAFLERAGAFTEEDPANCLAVHCKGGKGRTGVMLCAWLLYTRACPTADAAMERFAAARTAPGARTRQGVTQPSQQRYIRYTETLLARGGYCAPRLLLRSVVLRACPRLGVPRDGRYYSRYAPAARAGKGAGGPEAGRPPLIRVLDGEGRIVFDQFHSAGAGANGDSAFGDACAGGGGGDGEGAGAGGGRPQGSWLLHSAGGGRRRSTVEGDEAAGGPAAVTVRVEREVEGDFRVVLYDRSDDVPAQRGGGGGGIGGRRLQRSGQADRGSWADGVGWAWREASWAPPFGGAVGAGEVLLGFVCVHSDMIGERRTALPKAQVDVACQDRRGRLFPDAFAVELEFDRLPAPWPAAAGGAGQAGGGAAASCGGNANGVSLAAAAAAAAGPGDGPAERGPMRRIIRPKKGPAAAHPVTRPGSMRRSPSRRGSPLAPSSNRNSPTRQGPQSDFESAAAALAAAAGNGPVAVLGHQSLSRDLGQAPAGRAAV